MAGGTVAGRVRHRRTESKRTGSKAVNTVNCGISNTDRGILLLQGMAGGREWHGLKLKGVRSSILLIKTLHVKKIGLRYKLVWKPIVL